MKERIKEDICRINYLYSETDALYHQLSCKLGISDSVFVILYTAYTEGGSCMLQDIYSNSGISKQTINSALRTLEKEGSVYLEKAGIKNKRVLLTEKGAELAGKTAAKIYEAEKRTLQSWTEEEREQYIRLLEKYKHDFAKEADKI